MPTTVLSTWGNVTLATTPDWQAAKNHLAALREEFERRASQAPPTPTGPLAKAEAQVRDAERALALANARVDEATARKKAATLGGEARKVISAGKDLTEAAAAVTDAEL